MPPEAQSLGTAVPAKPCGHGLRAATEELFDRLPQVYLLLAVPLALFLATSMPPFQSPDELAHFVRIDQISQGTVLSGKVSKVPPEILQAYRQFQLLVDQWCAPLPRSNAEQAAAIRWSGQRVDAVFGNTAINSPLGYLPQTVAVIGCRALGCGVVRTMMAARLVNAAFALAISYLALGTCRRGRLAMFVVLLLPETMSLFASLNQEATLISCACLGFALLSRQFHDPAARKWPRFLLMQLALLVVVVQRIPNLPLLALPPLLGIAPPAKGRFGRWARWLFPLASALLAVLWCVAAFLSSKASISLSSQVSPAGQLRFLAHHPEFVYRLFGKALVASPHVFAGFVGNLGGSNTPMPIAYYAVMGALTAFALGSEMFRPERVAWRSFAAAAVILIGTVCGVYLSQYLVWTPVGCEVIEGVQGRYLVPVVMALAAVLPRAFPQSAAYGCAIWTAIAAQAVTWFYLPMTVIERYYLR